MLLDTKYTLTNSTQRSHNILARRLNKLEKLEGSATNIDPSGVIQPQLGMPKEFYENHTFHAQASVIQSGPSALETDRTGGGTASISTQSYFSQNSGHNTQTDRGAATNGASRNSTVLQTHRGHAVKFFLLILLLMLQQSVLMKQ